MCYNSKLAQYFKTVALTDPEVAAVVGSRSVAGVMSVFSGDSAYQKALKGAIDSCCCKGGEERKTRFVIHAAAYRVSQKLAQLVAS